jgi:uncharacterized protein (TIGR02246 family)
MNGEATMKRAARISAVVTTGLLMMAGVASAQVQPADTRSDEESIRKVIVEMTEGFNSHDGAAASRMYLPNAPLVTVRGEVMQGQAEIERGLSAIFATRAKAATHKTLNVSIRFLRPDIALAHVTNELSGLVAPDGQALPSHQELSLRVFTKADGVWKVAAFHNTMIRPFAAQPR